MKPTRPSASRRWSRASSRASIAATARPLVTAIPASDAAATIARRRCRRIASRWTRSSRPTPSIPATILRKPSRRPSPVAAQVGGERLGALAVGRAAPVVFVPQRRREAFLRLAAGHVAGERLAVDDRGEDAAFRANPLEGLDLGIGPARLRRRRRAEHDQEARARRAPRGSRRRGRRRRPARCRSRKIGRQPPGNRAIVGQPADQRRRNAKLLERLVQPVGDRLVAVAVAQEREITWCGAAAPRRRQVAAALASSPLRHGRANIGHQPPP